MGTYLSGRNCPMLKEPLATSGGSLIENHCSRAIDSGVYTSWTTSLVFNPRCTTVPPCQYKGKYLQYTTLFICDFFSYACRQAQYTFSTAGGTLPQKHCSCRGSQEKHDSSMVSWDTGKATPLDAATTCDSSSHLGSGRAFLRPWLPGLTRILWVGRLGTGSWWEGKSEGLQLLWTSSCLGTRWPVRMLPLSTDALSLAESCSLHAVGPVSVLGWVAFPLGYLWTVFALFQYKLFHRTDTGCVTLHHTDTQEAYLILWPIPFA